MNSRQVQIVVGSSDPDFDPNTLTILDYDFANPPKPRTLPRMRAAQIAWAGSTAERASAYYEQIARLSYSTVRNPPTERDLLISMHEARNIERQTFSGDLFAMTPDATHYAIRRSQDTVTDSALTDERFPVVNGRPATNGVILFGEPIGLAEPLMHMGGLAVGQGHIDFKVPIVAATWTKTEAAAKENGPVSSVVYFAFYSHGTNNVNDKRVPPFCFSYCLTWPMDDNEDEEQNLSAYRQNLLARARYVIASWDSYNKSRLIDTQTLKPGAKGRTRKQLKKSAATGGKFTESDPVRVLTFHADRREYKPTGPRDKKGKVYTCRWLVRSHVKHYHVKDPVTGETRREPRDIEEYVQGPRDKPLRIRETVRVVDR